MNDLGNPTRGVSRRLALARVLTLGTTLAVAGACGATDQPTSGPSGSPVSAQPSGPPVLGVDWARAVSVERPVNFEADPSASAYTGTHPILRIPGQATMADVVGLPDGGFAAVGYEPPGWVPAAWTSADGANWSIHEMGTTGFTFPVALALGADGTLVAVGRSGQAPTAWTSVDGISWEQHSVPVPGDSGVAERMTTVVAGKRGYVAGGSVGPELFERHARFWTSADGIDWQPVPDDPAAFATAEVRAITTFGDGFVAVGSDLDRREAVAWTSADGRSWTRAPVEASRQWPGGYVWMTDVVAIGDTVIAIGEDQGLQRGTATSWVSRDGLRWDRARTAPVQEQGEFYAITPGGPGAIVVGSFGAPDSYVPTVWLSPGR